MADDRMPRYRRLKSTGAQIFWHVCAECGSTDAPYGFQVVRVSCGQWIDERDQRGRKTGKKVWKGKDPIVNHGTWFCAKHRHLGQILERGVNSGSLSESASA